jgi:hypothetical protein
MTTNTIKYFQKKTPSLRVLRPTKKQAAWSLLKYTYYLDHFLLNFSPPRQQWLSEMVASRSKHPATPTSDASSKDTLTSILPPATRHSNLSLFRISMLLFDGEFYWAVSSHQARVKIAATFRDGLSDQYKSASKNRVAKRREAHQKQQNQRQEQEHRWTTVHGFPQHTLTSQSIHTIHCR